MKLILSVLCLVFISACGTQNAAPTFGAPTAAVPINRHGPQCSFVRHLDDGNNLFTCGGTLVEEPI